MCVCVCACVHACVRVCVRVGHHTHTQLRWKNTPHPCQSYCRASCVNVCECRDREGGGGSARHNPPTTTPHKHHAKQCNKKMPFHHYNTSAQHFTRHFSPHLAVNTSWLLSVMVSPEFSPAEVITVCCIILVFWCLCLVCCCFILVSGLCGMKGCGECRVEWMACLRLTYALLVCV